MLGPTCIFLLFLGLASGSDSWVAGFGGSATKDRDGNVTEVSLRSAWVPDSELARLSSFPKLRRLDLSLTHISDRALEVLKDLPALIDLDLTYAEHITDAGLARLRDAKNLERLVLEGAKITDSGVNSLTSLANLRSLNLRCTQITDGALEHLESLTRLEHLAIGGNRIAGFGLIHLQALPGLKHLDLSGAQLTDDGIWSVALSDLNIQTVATLKGLESLNLAASELAGMATIPDGGIREVATLRITDLGVEMLKQIESLRSLDLTRSRITARGLRSLSELPRLDRLSLAHIDRLDDSALGAIAQMKQLRMLDLSGVKVANRETQNLMRQNGALRVVGMTQ